MPLFHCIELLLPTFCTCSLQIITTQCLKPLWHRNHKREENKYFLFLYECGKETISRWNIQGCFTLNWEEFGICFCYCSYNVSVQPICSLQLGWEQQVLCTFFVSLLFQLSSNTYVCCARVWTIWHMIDNVGEGSEKKSIRKWALSHLQGSRGLELNRCWSKGTLVWPYPLFP